MIDALRSMESPSGLPVSVRSSLVPPTAGLRVSSANDSHEKVAERVASGSEFTGAIRPVWSIARLGSTPGTTAGGQRLETAVVPATVHETLQSSGRPLERDVREYFEPRFGHDFSSVRVHDDSLAASTAEVLHARAYSTANHVVFGNGGYDPGTAEGRSLLTHELTHVVQQRGAATGVIQRQPITAPMSPVATKETPDELAKDLRAVIAASTWKEVRKRIYPRESAAGVARAKERKAGNLTDLTGLGKISSLESFATDMRSVETRWATETTASPDDRAHWIGNAADKALTGASVPKLKDAKKKDMPARGEMDGSNWILNVQEKIVNQPTLTAPVGAADLSNTMLHECRHAEQMFTAARFAAGVKGLDAGHINHQTGINEDIAKEAVSMKMDPSAAPTTEKKLGETMFQAMGPDHDKNQKIEDGMSAEVKALDKTVAEATDAADKLDAKATPSTIAKARQERTALKQEVAKVEKQYSLYRAVPQEADAHEVGDAEEQAFRGWP